MTIPVRLQLSRRKGFDLQAISLATNGLPAVSVARPSKWGNPWTVRAYMDAGWSSERPHYIARKYAVEAFRAWLEGRKHWGHGSLLPPVPDLTPLRGLNLACWCGLHEPYDAELCHADVLLEFANR